MGQKDKYVGILATITAFSRSVKHLSSLDLKLKNGELTIKVVLEISHAYSVLC